MFNSTKNILRILIGTVILVIIVFIIVNLGSKSTTPKPKAIPNNGTIEHINGNNNNDDDSTNPDADADTDADNDLENLDDENNEELVDAPDTASTNTINLIIGSIVLTSGIIYINKSSN